MKNIFLSTLASCLLAVTANAQETQQPAPAPAQQEVSQSDFAYALSCSADSELNEDQVNFLMGNEQALATRQGFQAFVADPKGSIQGIVKNFTDLEAQITETLKTQYAKELKEAAEKYAADNKVSYEVAEKAVIDEQVQLIVQQQTQTDKVSAIVQASLQSCGLMDLMAEQLAKGGCKTSTGDQIDLTVATQYCTGLQPKIAAMEKPNEVLAAMQKELSEKIAVLQKELQAKVEALQKEAQEAAQPTVDDLNAQVKSLYDWAVDFAGQPVPATEIPLITTTP